MTIPLADGQAIQGDLVAVLDEAAPEVGPGIYYVVTTAIIMDPAPLRDDLDRFFDSTPDRTNPFHWHKEGRLTRQRMVDLIVDAGVVAICLYQSTSRKGQKSARRQLLEVLSDRLAHEEIDHLMIENGDRSSNRRDQATLLDHYQTRGGVPFTYDWRSKQERLLWIADAISGVVADDFRTNNDEQILQRLIDNGVLAEPPEYVA